MGGVSNSTGFIETNSNCGIDLPEACTGSTLGGTAQPTTTSGGIACDPQQDEDFIINNIINNLPSECSYLRDTSELDTMEKFVEFYSTLCKPQCGNPIIEHVQGCIVNISDYAYYMLITISSTVLRTAMAITAIPATSSVS